MRRSVLPWFVRNAKSGVVRERAVVAGELMDMDIAIYNTRTTYRVYSGRIGWYSWERL
jgi:hypothetical protein